MQKEAADLLFDYEMEYHDELKRVNHREYLRESASPTEIREQASNNNTDAIQVQVQDLDAAIQTLEEQNTDTAPQSQSTENTDEIIDYTAENTDSIQDFQGENTDAVEDKKESKRIVISDDERALREKLGMLDEDEENYPQEDESQNADEIEDEDAENTDEVEEPQDNEYENTDAQHLSLIHI